MQDYASSGSTRADEPVPAALPFASAYAAAHHANEAVKLGLVSPACLLAGVTLRHILNEQGADFVGADGRRTLTHLWREVDKREAEVAEAERTRQRKVGRRPNAYVCAAEGCEIGALQRAALRRCAGGCPPELKPSYCSAACQKKVRRGHELRKARGSDHVLPFSSLRPAGLAAPQAYLQGPGCERRRKGERADGV